MPRLRLLSLQAKLLLHTKLAGRRPQHQPDASDWLHQSSHSNSCWPPPLSACSPGRHRCWAAAWPATCCMIPPTGPCTAAGARSFRACALPPRRLLSAHACRPQRGPCTAAVGQLVTPAAAPSLQGGLAGWARAEEQPHGPSLCGVSGVPARVVRSLQGVGLRRSAAGFMASTPNTQHMHNSCGVNPHTSASWPW